MLLNIILKLKNLLYILILVITSSLLFIKVVSAQTYTDYPQIIMCSFEGDDNFLTLDTYADPILVYNARNSSGAFFSILYDGYDFSYSSESTSCDGSNLLDMVASNTAWYITGTTTVEYVEVDTNGTNIFRALILFFMSSGFLYLLLTKRNG